MRLHYQVLDGEFLRAGEASSDLKKALKQLGVPADKIRKIAVSVYEAEINMVIHANGGVIDAEIFPDRVYVALQDAGQGIADIDQAMRAGFSTASHQARGLGFGAGMGLPNMKKNADDLKITSAPGQGTLVEISVHLDS